MPRKTEILLLLMTDLIMISLGWSFYYVLRVRSGIISVNYEPDILAPLLLVYAFWLLVFFMVGLYRPWYAASRFDELALLFKTITFGCLFLFFVVFVDDQGKNIGANSRFLIVAYWGIMLVFVGTGRLLIRSIQRRMLMAGIGASKTIIVGNPDKAAQLYRDVKKYPALGYSVVGYAGLSDHMRSPEGLPTLGSIRNLHDVLAEGDIKQVLIALDSSEHEHLLDIIGQCNSRKVGLKIIPDLYDIISGQARTNQIYGFPLIEISPQLMSPWEESLKRILDVSVASVVLVVGMPFWMLIGMIIKLESDGPVIYRQERVGKDGMVFPILKFRTMRKDAEKAGPQWAGKQDPRVTRTGKILRKLHLDEIPQAWNVLKGDMSLVGPRPERPVFVAQLSKEIPLYSRRLKVRPGITGWAQVKHTYDETIDDVRKKVQYDLFYIENMSLRMDFKIMLSTVYHMLLGRGR